MARTMPNTGAAFRVVEHKEYDSGRESLSIYGPYATKAAAKGQRTRMIASLQRWSRGIKSYDIRVQEVTDPQWKDINDEA